MIHRRIFTFSMLGLLLFMTTLLFMFSVITAQEHQLDDDQAVYQEEPTEAPDDTDVPWNDPFFNPYDGRIDPKPDDRVAIYCYPQYREIEVWGIDDKSQGFPLHVFDYDDTLAAGSKGITVRLKQMGTVKLSVDREFNFLAVWTGPYNGGSGNFSKAFRCEVLGGSPTPRPTTPKPRPYVYTITPAPSLTPVPTQKLY